MRAYLWFTDQCKAFRDEHVSRLGALVIRKSETKTLWSISTSDSTDLKSLQASGR